MREFLVVVIFLFGLAFTLLATSVIQDAVTYRDAWYQPKDLERGVWILKQYERRQR